MLPDTPVTGPDAEELVDRAAVQADETAEPGRRAGAGHRPGGVGEVDQAVDIVHAGKAAEDRIAAAGDVAACFAEIDEAARAGETAAKTVLSDADVAARGRKRDEVGVVEDRAVASHAVDALVRLAGADKSARHAEVAGPDQAGGFARENIAAVDADETADVRGVRTGVADVTRGPRKTDQAAVDADQTTQHRGEVKRPVVVRRAARRAGHVAARPCVIDDAVVLANQPAADRIRADAHIAVRIHGVRRTGNIADRARI